MKLLLKILVLPILLILKILTLAIKVVIHVSAYVAGPLMLFITGCLIYCLVKTRWTDVILLGCMDGFVFLVFFFAGWFTCIIEDSCEWLSAFLYS